MIGHELHFFSINYILPNMKTLLFTETPLMPSTPKGRNSTSFHLEVPSMNISDWKIC